MPGDIINKLHAGDELRITVVGGSVTFGTHCQDLTATGTECAWPQRMQDRLQQVFSNANITVRNSARPGHSYRSWLESGDLMQLLDTDILLVDLQVNSQVGMPT
jgi:hypothetical protein